MKIHFSKKTKTVALIIFTVLLFVAAVTSIILFKGKLGVELGGTTVIEVQLDHNVTVETVRDEFDKFAKTTRVEGDGTSRFRVYYRELDGDTRNKIKSDMGNTIKVVKEIKVFVNNPFPIAQYKEVILVVSGLSFIVAAVYFFTSLRNIGLKRGMVINYFLTELFSAGYVGTIVLGLAALLGQVYLYMDLGFIATLMFVLGLYFVTQLFVHLRFREFLAKHSAKVIALSWKDYIDQDWPTVILVSVLIVVMVLLPFTITSLVLAANAFLGVISLVFGLFIQLKLKFHLLNIFPVIGGKIPLIKNLSKSVAKPW